MREESFEYKGRRVKLRNFPSGDGGKDSDRKITAVVAATEWNRRPSIVIDGREVDVRILPSGEFFVSDYAYDWQDDLDQLARNYIDWMDDK